MKYNKEDVIKLSTLFAAKIGACGKRDSMDCANCDFAEECLSMEVAKQTQALGYVSTNTPNVSEQNVENIAKDIACVRGYGCDNRDTCSKCTCLILGCIPLQLAEAMAEAGFAKKEG